MCMIDGADEMFHFYQRTQQKARKTHKCGECCREIQPREMYERAYGVYEGRGQTFKTCTHCMGARRWLDIVCSGFLHDGVAEDLREHADDYESQWLARAVYGISNCWRRRDGTMLPIPREPNPSCLKPHWERKTLFPEAT